MHVPPEPTSLDRPVGGAGPARWGRTWPVLTAVAAVLVLATFPAATASATSSATAQADPTISPITTISPDGRTGTDGTRTLALSQAADLDGSGTTMAVSGSGYDENKGIYVALCVIPPRNHVPSPCGGGVDTEGTQGAAQWISSNPPSYGVGLAQPYGPGGSFQTSFVVRPEISAGIDCRQVRCAIVTRNDHTRTSDRSQDLIVPVTFRAPPAVTVTSTAPDPAPTVPGGAGPPPTSPTTAPAVTVPPLANPTTTAVAPVATVSADGRSVSDGERTLAVTVAADLDPERQTVTVTGQGFDATRGIYVSLCAVAAGAAPGPCRTGSVAANRWVSSNPPDYGIGVATPFGSGGTFAVDLTVAARIDGVTDCRTTVCAILTRADDTAPDDRTLDLAIPVSFAATSTSIGSTAPATTRPADGGVAEDETESASSVVIDGTSSSAGTVIAVAAGAAVLALVAGGIVARRRRATANGTAGVAVEPASSAAGTGPNDPEQSS